MADQQRSVFWVWFERLGPVVMLCALIVGFSIVDAETFATLRNTRAILVQTAILATCSLGMTMIMIAGGLDLAVGSILALSSVAGAAVYASTGSPLLAGASCVLAGLTAGSVNGLLIAGLRFNPFIATLGMMGVARGVARELAGDSKIYLSYTEAGGASEAQLWSPKLLELFPTTEPWKSIGVPLGVIMTLLLIIALIVIMRTTIFGRHVYAIGSNEDAARLCGVRVAWRKFIIYAAAGLLFGIAGFMQLSYDNAGDPVTRMGFELNVIAAVVIGGASLSGGAGSMLGSVVGALIMVVLTNGCVIAGVPAARQQIIIGLIIIGAVALDMFRQGTLPIPRWLKRSSGPS